MLHLQQDRTRHSSKSLLSNLLQSTAQFYSTLVHLKAAPELSAHDMARLYMQSVVRLHGIVCESVSDRDVLFTSAFWEDICIARHQDLQVILPVMVKLIGSTGLLKR